MTDSPRAPAPDGVLSVWDQPKASEVGHDVHAFLERLPGPTCITLAGTVEGRPRVLTTLLHGNEPSGSIAIHRFLREGIRPRVPLILALLSVDAAREQPAFGHRALPGRRDLNRCFAPPWAGPDGERARALWELVCGAQPEAIVDLHNTSGRGPAYAVCTRVDPPHEALTSHFAERIIHTDLRLNTFMESVEALAPTITVECGGAAEPEAHERAYHGLCRYARSEEVLRRPSAAPRLPVLRHPLRVELADGACVQFQHGAGADADVTLPPDVDLHNFSIMRQGVPIGWLGERGLGALRVVGADGVRPIEAFFDAGHAREGRLVPARDLEPLMTTTDAVIARGDCLFYLVPFE